MTVAEMIKKTRTDCHMTQEEYGRKFGVTRQTVSSWENARSMPDLQMLIDICNTYHISLDALLNEDQAFVEKIDYYSRYRKWVKIILSCVAAVALILAVTLVGWQAKANRANEAFSEAALQMGFVMEDGHYVLRSEDGIYALPNQKLPFLKGQFNAQYSEAFLNIGEAEVEIHLYYGEDVTVEWNHYRSVKGHIDSAGRFVIEDNSLNEKEWAQYTAHEKDIHRAIEKLRIIHQTAYR